MVSWLQNQTKLRYRTFQLRHAARRAVVVEALTLQLSELVRGSRQKELLAMMATDPYGAVTDVLSEAAIDPRFAADPRIDRGLAIVDRLTQTRAARLSAEALSLPATHFSILATLGALLVIAYVLTGASVDWAANKRFEISKFKLKKFEI